MTNGFVKVNGVQKNIVAGYAKVNGQWKTITVVSDKVNGVWKQSWKNAFPTPSFLTYPSSITRGQTITWTTESIAGAVYEYQISNNAGATWGSSSFNSTNTASYTITTDTTINSFQMRVRAVDSVTHGSQSSWRTGPNVFLNAQILESPTGLSYPSTIARGDKIEVSWTAVDTATTYEVHVYYIDGTGKTKTDAIVYSNKAAHSGSISINQTVTTDTKWSSIQYAVIAKKTGYFDSAPTYGNAITLVGQKLGKPASINVPTPTKGSPLTVSWGAVSDAAAYMVNVWTDKTSPSRIYWGPNRSISYTVPNNNTDSYIEFSVKATAPNYTDGDIIHSPSLYINPPPLKSATWKATATHNWRPQFHGIWDGDDTYFSQGEWNDSNGTYGNYKSIALFDYQNIRNTLKGRTVEKVQVYLYRNSFHHGYWSGQKVELYTHNYASHPSGEPMLWYADGPMGSFALGQGTWLTVKNVVAERIRDGQAAGLGIYMPDGSGYVKFASNVQLYVEYR